MESDQPLLTNLREQYIGEPPPETSGLQPTQPAVLATLPPPIVESPALNPPTIAAVETPTISIQPTAQPSLKIVPTSQAFIEQIPVPPRSFGDLLSFYEMDFPVHDYYANALEQGDLQIGPRTLTSQVLEVGARKIFQTENGNIEATLVAITDNAYFWVEDSLFLEDSEVQSAAAILENEYLDKLNHLFGLPWQPGIDGDAHFSILHLAGYGEIYELGYFSDQDEYPQTIFEDSNQQEIVYLNMGRLDIGSELYFGTLVHELQHLFQWNLDKNETIWMNEGLSGLAEKYSNLDTVIADAYLDQPSTRLDRWDYEDDVIDAHYANSFLFNLYIYEQLGEEAIFELVRHPDNGLIAVRKVLMGFQPDRSLEQFIADWAVANFLDDLAVDDRFSYTSVDLPKPKYETRIRQLPFDQVLDIDQLSVHYIDIDHQGPLTLNFTGNSVAKLISSPPPSGDRMWYSPSANDTNAQLTGYFDLRNVDRATFNFKVWYDLEQDFDYALVSVSTDNGDSWTAVPEREFLDDLGSGYFTGQSVEESQSDSGWIPASISLDSFTGNEILIRFSVLTDYEGFGRGFALDDFNIPELNYYNDVESDDQNWVGAGFTQTGWLLPQRWALRLIEDGPVPKVTELPLDPLNQIQQTVNLSPEGGTLMIMPLTPFTEESARYWLRAFE